MLIDQMSSKPTLQSLRNLPRLANQKVFLDYNDDINFTRMGLCTSKKTKVKNIPQAVVASCGFQSIHLSLPPLYPCKHRTTGYSLSEFIKCVCKSVVLNTFDKSALQQRKNVLKWFFDQLYPKYYRRMGHDKIVIALIESICTYDVPSGLNIFQLLHHTISTSPEDKVLWIVKQVLKRITNGLHNHSELTYLFVSAGRHLFDKNPLDLVRLFEIQAVFLCRTVRWHKKTPSNPPPLYAFDILRSMSRLLLGYREKLYNFDLMQQIQDILIDNKINVLVNFLQKIYDSENIVILPDYYSLLEYNYDENSLEFPNRWDICKFSKKYTNMLLKSYSRNKMDIMFQYNGWILENGTQKVATSQSRSSDIIYLENDHLRSTSSLSTW